MMMKIEPILVIVALVAVTLTAAATNDLAISLHQRVEKGEVMLDILVSNVSTAAVEIVSEGIAPPWSVCAWFQWKVDGEDAQYLENVAGIPSVRESWLIPKDGVVLWASIPIRSLEHRIKNEQGREEWRSVISDKNRHTITIMPGRQWREHRLSLLAAIGAAPKEIRKERKIALGWVEIGKEDTEPTAAAAASSGQ